MSFNLKEYILYRTEIGREFFNGEVDTNFKMVANPWTEFRSYEEGNIVYHQVKIENPTGESESTGNGETALGWWRANQRTTLGVFNINEWDLVGGIGVGDITLSAADGFGKIIVNYTDEFNWQTGNNVLLSSNSPNDTLKLVSGQGISLQYNQSTNSIKLINTGVQGPQGFIGATGIGESGAQGPQGSQGLMGPIGATGIGATGQQGFTGSTGEFGSVGATGAQGPQGFTGSTGFIGATGPQGPQGFTGSTGFIGATGITGTTGPQGPQGEPGTDNAVYGQISKITSGTINIVETGVYQSTGLTGTLDVESDGIGLGTADTFAIKNITNEPILVKIYGSADINAGNQRILGIKLALNGEVINETECRASTGMGTSFAKLVTNWMTRLEPNDEVALYVTNFTSAGNITFDRGRLVASTIGKQGEPGFVGATGLTGATGPKFTTIDQNIIDYLPTIDLDMAAITGTIQTIELAGSTTFITSNREAGRFTSIRILGGSVGGEFGFPVDWTFVGSKPSNIIPNKTGILSLTYFGSTDADCVASYLVEA
jgi:hypothetical protein